MVSVLVAAGCVGGVEEPGDTDRADPSDALPCVVLSQETVDFGRLSPDERVERAVEVRNACGGALELRSVELDEVSPRSDITAYAPSRPLLGPDETATVRVEIVPTTGGTYSGTLLLRTSDPERPRVRLPLQGVSMAPRLEVEEPALADREIGCASEGRLVVDNGGATDLTLRDIRVEGFAADRFELDLSQVPLPRVLQPDVDEPVEVPIGWRPTTVGRHVAELVIESDDPQTTERRLSMTLNATSARLVRERFEVPLRSKADVLITLSRATSMFDSVTSLVDNYPGLVRAVRNHRDDVRLAIVVADDGCVLGREPYIDASLSAPDSEEALVTMSDFDFEQAPGRTLVGRGFELADAAIAPENVEGGACNASFYRQDAALGIVFIADHDTVRPDYEELVDSWRARKDDPDRLSLHAIAGPTPDGCFRSGASTTFANAVDYAGGTFHSICGDLETAFEAIVDASVVPRRRFVLEQVPVESTLDVRVNDEVMSDWIFEEDTRSVVLAEPPLGDSTVDVTYIPRSACTGG